MSQRLDEVLRVEMQGWISDIFGKENMFLCGYVLLDTYVLSHSVITI